jgi:hypothetical protein
MGLVKWDSSSYSQPKDLSFRVFPYKVPILIAHPELEPFVLDEFGKEGQPHHQSAQGLVVQGYPYQG